MILPTTPPLLLALDLASHRTGWCLWRTEADWTAGSEAHAGPTLVARLDSLRCWVETMLELQRPAALWVEAPDLEARGIRTTRPATLKALHMAHGVVLATALTVDAPPEVHERDARSVREAIVGLATASKADVQLTLRRRGLALPMRGERVDHDACDAVALALAVHDEWAMERRAVAG